MEIRVSVTSPLLPPTFFNIFFQQLSFSYKSTIMIYSLLLFKINSCNFLSKGRDSNLFCSIQQKPDMFHGDFSPSIFFRYSSSFLVFAITIIYFISQHLGQEPPVTWISSCAGHYPEFLIFRFSTITGAVFILLGWMTNYFYLKSVSLQSGFNLQRYQPQIPMVLGMMGALFITVSTASIDTGVRKGKLHVHCAAGFFSCTLLAIFYNTALYWLVYNNTKNVSRTLLIVKSLLVGVIVLIIIANESKKVESEGFWSDKDVYIEWIASYTVAAYMYAMGEDVKGFRYQYQQAKTGIEVEQQ